MRRPVILAAVGLLLACGLTRGADPVAPAGFWKITVPSREGDVVLMVAFTEQDKKWIGDYLASSEKLGVEPKFKSLKVNGDNVQFSLEVEGRELVSFDGVVSKDKKKIAGSMSLLGGQLLLTELQPTKL